MRHSNATSKAAEETAASPVRRKRRKRRRRSAGANKAVSKSWADSKKLAEKEGISVKEARSKLAKGKG